MDICIFVVCCCVRQYHILHSHQVCHLNESKRCEAKEDIYLSTDDLGTWMCTLVCIFFGNISTFSTIIRCVLSGLRK